MKIATVIGARPQFIKAAPVSRALRSVNGGAEITEILIHTGQHYDPNMSQVFFDELGLPTPHYNLAIGSGCHGWQTGQMLAAIEGVLLEESPDCVLIYGDTNSTLAGALAASKLHIPVAHVEAGLRSFNRRMPEELNRIVADQLSDLLFAPTDTATDNLAREGIERGVHLVGDVMEDAIAEHIAIAEARSTMLEKLELIPKKYLLATVHRAENTDSPERLQGICQAFERLSSEWVIVWPVHPRTRKYLKICWTANVQLVDPAGYLDMLILQKNARVILTDSGGVQKEARWLQVPCVTLRDETEWVETLEGRWNQLVGADTNKILEAVRYATNLPVLIDPPANYRTGAAQRIAQIISDRLYTCNEFMEVSPAWAQRS